MEKIKESIQGPKNDAVKKIILIRKCRSDLEIKSPVKIAEELTKINSTIKDLIQLSHRHNIENKLYNRDVIDKIYKIIGIDGIQSMEE